MSNEENERLYNVRAAIPDHLEIFARWADESMAVRAKLAKCAQLDLAYGPDLLQRLDLFRTDRNDAPLQIFLHGGYWQAMDKSFFSFLAPAFLKSGISLAVVNYRLCPKVSLNELAHDVTKALVWLSAQGETYGYDENRLHVSGHSAGGHLAALALTQEVTAPLIASAVSISGLFDLRPLIETTINDKIGLDLDTAMALSPAYRAPLSSVPLLLGVGALESEGFHGQSDLLKKKWNDVFTTITRIDLANCHHMAAVEQLGEPKSRLFASVLSLMKGAK